MPNSVLNQLKALRDGVAQDLRKDPRYLTLQALDKSIEEVTAVLSASGLLPATPAPSLTSRLNGLAPQADRYAEPAAVLSSGEHPAAEPENAAARSSLGFKDGTAGSPPPVVPHSLFAPSSTPALEVAGAAAVAAAVAEVVEATVHDHETVHGGDAALDGEPAPQDHHREWPGDHEELETSAAPAESAPDAQISHEHVSHEHVSHESVSHEPESGSVHEPVAADHATGLSPDHHGDSPLVVDSAGDGVPAEAMKALTGALFEGETTPEAAPRDETRAEPQAETHDEPQAKTHVEPAVDPDHHAAGLEHFDGHAHLEEPVAVTEASGADDHLTAHLEAALEEMAAKSVAAQTAAAAAHEPAGDGHAAGPEAETDEAHVALEAHEAHPAQEAGPAHEPVEHPAAGHAAGEPVAAHDAALEEPAHGEDHDLAALHEPAGAASDPAFDMIAADAIAAALFADETPGAEPPAEAPHAVLESGEHEAAAHAETHEPPVADESALDGIESAIAAALFADEPEPAEAAAATPTAGIIPGDKASGYLAMAPKPGAAQYSPSIAVKFGKLPARVDLRPLLPPAEDQGTSQSAVAHAVAAAYEYWIQKATKKPQRISRSFIYFNARWRAGQTGSDAGSAIQLALEGLQRFGACPETAWPWHAGLLTQQPGAGAYRDAAAYRVHDMAQVPLKVEAWKQALAEGKPVVFGLVIFETFAACTEAGGVVAMPAPEEAPHAAYAVHALCACGYNDAEKVFIVRNSWGEAFGDKGYCYIPYDYLMNPKFNDGDAWIFVPKVPSQPPRETWSETQDPVVNAGHGVDFVIPSYPASEYTALGHDFFEHARQPWHAEAPGDYSASAAKVAKNQFDELAPFDVKAFLAAQGEAVHEDAAPEAVAGPESGKTDGDEWGDEASWGESTAIDHSRTAPAPHHESEANADAEFDAVAVIASKDRSPAVVGE